MEEARDCIHMGPRPPAPAPSAPPAGQVSMAGWKAMPSAWHTARSTPSGWRTSSSDSTTMGRWLPGAGRPAGRVGRGEGVEGGEAGERANRQDQGQRGAGMAAEARRLEMGWCGWGGVEVGVIEVARAGERSQQLECKGGAGAMRRHDAAAPCHSQAGAAAGCWLLAHPATRSSLRISSSACATVWGSDNWTFRDGTFESCAEGCVQGSKNVDILTPA